MKTADSAMLMDVQPPSGLSAGDSKIPSHKRARGKLLFAAGILGILSAVCIIAAPELGLTAAISGTLIAGAGSAGMTLLSRR